MDKILRKIISTQKLYNPINTEKLDISEKNAKLRREMELKQLEKQLEEEKRKKELAEQKAKEAKIRQEAIEREYKQKIQLLTKLYNKKNDGINLVEIGKKIRFRGCRIGNIGCNNISCLPSSWTSSYRSRYWKWNFLSCWSWNRRSNYRRK